MRKETPSTLSTFNFQQLPLVATSSSSLTSQLAIVHLCEQGIYTVIEQRREKILTQEFLGATIVMLNQVDGT